MLVNIGKDKEYWVNCANSSYITCHIAECYGTDIKCEECILTRKDRNGFLISASVDISEFIKSGRVKEG